MTSDTTPHPAGHPVGGGGHGGHLRAAGAVNASEKTLLVLEAILTHARFTDVVEATGLAKATTHRILATLVDARFVTVGDDIGVTSVTAASPTPGVSLSGPTGSGATRTFTVSRTGNTDATIQVTFTVKDAAGKTATGNAPGLPSYGPGCVA